MSTHKYIDRICIAITIFALIICILFMNAKAFGVQEVSKVLGYESRLFDTSRVHTIDIVMDDWDGFLETCENEEYKVCSVVIDGEAYKNVGIRAKGNTSLSTVSAMNSNRYSFKIEFDQYDSTKSYYGLDKFSLNNLIQDNTCMKDYMVYQMMNAFGVNAPLSSYAYITVNGEDWGLYLAVESVEEAFLQRNYGKDYGELYKPDSMSFGGGRGNGRNFDPDVMFDAEGGQEALMPEIPEEGEQPKLTEGVEIPELPEGVGEADMPDMPQRGNFGGEGKDFGGSGMGSDDVKLKYIDDDPESYSNIFDNAKTDPTSADKTRLIQSLKALSEGTDIENVVEVEEVLRYFVVHNFVCNGDSYTGSIVHNYYLYEKDGKLSMIPWDYNLAFGTFQSASAADSVNEPIDTPVTSGELSDRPMVAWIFEEEEYTEQYHTYFAEFLASMDFAGMMDETAELIAPYVEKDPTKFCTYEEFEKGVAALKSFCELRAQSVEGQIAGEIPSTAEGQAEDPDALIDTSGLTISDMGDMGSNGGRGGDVNNGFPAGDMDGGFPSSERGDGFPDSDMGGGFPGGDMGDRPNRNGRGQSMEKP